MEKHSVKTIRQWLRTSPGHALVIGLIALLLLQGWPFWEGLQAFAANPPAASASAGNPGHVVTTPLALTQALACLHNGNVDDSDAAITPGDVVRAFQHFLGLAIPPLDACQHNRANVRHPLSTGVTPADALCIFQRFLGLPSCLDNTPPVADAGRDQTLMAGTTVQLDGRASSDPDGGPLMLRFHWTLATLPTGSGAVLADPQAPQPTFVADVGGTYTVELVVDDGREASAVDTVTITATADTPQPPTLEPVGDQTVALGRSLTLPLTARDVNGDALTFGVAPLPLLANATLGAQSGVFTFRPTADQVGTVQLTFTVSDGIFTASETITITVQGPQPGEVTALTGRVLDTNDFVRGVTTPVVGATVSVLNSGVAASSDADGNFTLSGLPAGRQILDINTSTANLAPDGSPYAGFREALTLLEGVMNVVERPFFLPRIDPDSLTAVNPNDTTTVANPTLGAVLTIGPNTARNPDGSNFSGMVSISVVPEGLAPAALPANLGPGLLVTIQPVGVRFDTPVPLTLPNVDNLPPGAELDLWSLDPQTGQFVVVGRGRVSADGTVIETISGGVRAADWHLFLPQAFSLLRDPNSNNTCQCRRKCCDRETGSRTAVASGNLTVDHTLASYRSLNVARAPRLVYNSLLAAPQPVMSTTAMLPVQATVPPLISARLQVAGMEQEFNVFTNPGSLGSNDPVRQALLFDASSLATGLYPVQLTLTSHYERSTVASASREDVLVHNARNSPFGAGWTLDGLARLHRQPDGKIILTEGDGSALLYTPAMQGSGDFVAARNFRVGSLPVGSQPLAMAFDDFNNDSQLDLVTFNLTGLTEGSVIALALGDGQGGFALPQEFAAGQRLDGALVVGDFNGDRNLDVAVASGNVSILLGDGNGAFAAAQTTPSVGGVPTAIAMGDFNGDTRLDLAVTVRNTNTVAVLLGDGRGTFEAPVSFPVGQRPSALVAGDVNSDGALDLAVANSNESSVSVLLGAGNGSFATATPFVTGAGPVAMVAGDFNNDDRLDLATVNGATVSLLLGNGAGAFAAPVNVPTAGDPRAIVTADVNQDSALDLVVSHSNFNTIALLLGDGNGSFAAPVLFAAGPDPTAVAVADVDDDGQADVAVLDRTAQSVAILRGDGVGGLTETPGFAIGTTISPTFFASGDVTGDGVLDLVTGEALTGVVTILAGDGRGGFTTAGDLLIGTTDQRGLTLGDVNQDNRLDIAVVAGSNTVALLVSDGRGAFNAPQLLTVGNTPSAIVGADLNNDSLLDFAVANSGSNTVSLLRGDGNGAFTATTVAVGRNPRAVAVGDVNGDGALDLAVANAGDNTVTLLRGNGAGDFVPLATPAVGGSLPQGVVLRDLNGDGAVDLAVLNTTSGDVAILLGNGSGAFAAPVMAATGLNPVGMAVADADGDGTPDLLIASRDTDDVIVLLGDGGGNFTEFRRFAVRGALDAVVPMGTADVNGDGLDDLLVAPNAGSGARHELAVLLGRPSGQMGLQSPDGDFSVLEQRDDGTVTRTMPDGTRILFDARGLQTALSDRNGNTTTYAYDGSGSLSRITDPVGLVTTLSYQGNLLSRITDPAERQTTFEHDANGNLVRITDPDETSRVFAYDAQHRMITQTSKRGFDTTYTYDFAGRNVLVTRPDGSTNVIAPGETVGLIGPGSDLGTRGNPAAVVRPADVRATFMDGNGGVTTYRTERFGASTETIDPLGRRTVATRDRHGNLLQIVEANGVVSAMTYDNRGNLVSLREAIGTLEERQMLLEYESQFNQPTRLIDPSGAITTFAYDARGNLTQRTNPLGHQFTLTYDNQGLPLTQTDENGNTSTTSYDAQGNPLTDSDAMGNIIRFARDPAGTGNVTAFTEGVGRAEERTTVFTYDALNRLLAVTNATEAETQWRYDAAGNVLEFRNATNQGRRQGYDERERLITIEDPEQGVTEILYDANDNAIEIVDALGQSTSFTYDAGNQLRQILGGDDEQRFAYDAVGNRVSVQDGRGNVVAFVYDPLNRQIQRTNPLGTTATFTYDTRDNLLIRTEAGQRIEYTYNALSRSTQVTTPDDTLTLTFDAVGNPLTIENNDSQLAFVYDPLNRIREVQTVDRGHQPATTLTYTYDALGNRQQVMDSAGGLTQLNYNAADFLTSIQTSASGIVSQTFDAAGRLAQVAFPNAATAAYQYDEQGLLTSLVHSIGSGTTLSDLAYAYNAVGSISEVTEGSETRTFTYDTLRQLTEGGTTVAPEQYAYDAAGNRVSSHLSTEYMHDAANRLLEDDGFTYTYDARGNVLTKTARSDGAITTYTYDALNRLRAINLPDGTTATYRYDGLGRRIAKDVNGAITRYVYDGPHILLEYDGSNALQARYTHGHRLDQVLSMVRGDEVFFYHADHLGSIRAITDIQGTVVNRYTYESYGRMVQDTTGVHNPFTYAGREHDAESGLYYYRARYYDARMGRFLSEDPIGLLGRDLNLYRYVLNNPQNLVDPSGRILPLILVGAAIGAAVFGGAEVYIQTQVEYKSIGDVDAGGVATAAAAGAAVGAFAGATAAAATAGGSFSAIFSRTTSARVGKTLIEGGIPGGVGAGIGDIVSQLQRCEPFNYTEFLLVTGAGFFIGTLGGSFGFAAGTSNPASTAALGAYLDVAFLKSLLNSAIFSYLARGIDRVVFGPSFNFPSGQSPSTSTGSGRRNCCGR